MPPPGATERLGLFDWIVKLRAAAGFEACAAESDFESKVSFDARNLAICDGEEDGRPFFTTK